MTKILRIAVSVLTLALLGGCGFLSVSHPTTESQTLSRAEQDFWADRTTREDKSRQWSAELERQSDARMTARRTSPYFGF